MNSKNITDYAKNIRAALHQMLPPTLLGTISAGDEKRILTARSAIKTPPGMKLVFEGVTIATESNIAANNTDYWQFQIVNITRTLNLLSAAVTTKSASGGAIAADTAWEITCDQNTTINPGDVIELQIVKGGSAGNMDEFSVTPIVHWEEA